MAHYAFIDENNYVTQVIVGRDEWEEVNGITDWESYYASKRGQRCLRTSYNNNIRGNFATVGAYYSDELDQFSAPKPFPSWNIDDAMNWQPPAPYPTDGGQYFWDEDSLNWILIEGE